jgi:hypothetical protein
MRVWKRATFPRVVVNGDAYLVSQYIRGSSRQHKTHGISFVAIFPIDPGVQPFGSVSM